MSSHESAPHSVHSPVEGATAPLIEHQNQFAEADKSISPRNIFVVTPDEYEDLARLGCEDAADLPDGAYLVDETIRERLGMAGIDYDNLSRAIVSGVETQAAAPSAQALTRTGKARSKHQVFFGSITLEGPAIDASQYDGKILIAIKPHENNEDKSYKAYHEVGNAALLQSLEMPGIYRPVGIIKQGDTRFVMTEQRPGIRTLDDHNWLKNSTGETPHGREREQLRERDTAIVGKVFELLGMLHARGIFHGDAQEKNLGWANRIPSGTPFTVEQLADLSGIQMTIIDLENSDVFHRDEGGDFEPGYYANLLHLATNDLRMFFRHVPKGARFPKPGFEGDKQVATYTIDERNKITEDFVQSHYIDKYLQTFADERAILLGYTGEAKREEIMDALSTEVSAALRPYYLEEPKLSRKERRQAKREQEPARD